MVVAAFSIVDKANWVRFFKETFLVANIWLEVVLQMFFFTLSGVDVDFLDRKLWWGIYITKEALLTIKCIKLVEKKEFAAAVLNLEHETYIVHVASLSFTLFVAFLGFILLNVHPFWKS